MIVIGYQGIGKSTLAGRDHMFIDLESSNFWVDGKRAADWYKPYCQIAEHLSQQGYIVFVSSHEVVRKQLEGSGEYVVVCFPALKLKDAWIEKLEQRYEENHTEKNYKALMNAITCYEENIRDLMSITSMQKIPLTDMNYRLGDILTLTYASLMEG